MIVYVDELPECCSKCPCMNDDIEYGNHCNLICVNGLKLCLDCDDCQHFRHKDCPLTTTQSLKQQVREVVVEEIRAELNKQKLVMKSDFHPREEEAIPWEDIVAILDQVKGEIE